MHSYNYKIKKMNEIYLPKDLFCSWLVLTLQADEIRLELLGSLHEIPRVPLNINCSFKSVETATL
jgi:hypothetical protein